MEFRQERSTVNYSCPDPHSLVPPSFIQQTRAERIIMLPGSEEPGRSTAPGGENEAGGELTGTRRMGADVQDNQEGRCRGAA